MNASFNYNENNVVKFTVNQDENETKNETKKMEVASASIDVSSLGGSSTLAIVPDLQAVTISATTDTSLGKKTLPIVVTDQYGNEYSTSVQVEVTARTRKNAKDFDWDESVIYFMVTTASLMEMNQTIQQAEHRLTERIMQVCIMVVISQELHKS